MTDHRIWGTMARFRPLLTVVEESLNSRAEAGDGNGRHHFVLSGGETPLAWELGGGDRAIPTTWHRFRSLLASTGADPGLYRDHVSLFQRVVVDVPSQRFEIVPSQAMPGDAIALFAEIALQVALVPSPFRGGGVLPSELDGSTHPVQWEVRHVPIAAPGWPYPGVPYPDLGPYLDENGRRR
jgi:uncharacterized protein YcgI (DUF1989 family)